MCMYIFPINLSRNNNLAEIKSSRANKGLGFDAFEKQNNITFLSNTSAGNSLKKLKQMNCAYFDVEMILGCDFNSIEKLIDNCETSSEYLKVLSNYSKKNMLSVEKKIYRYFVKALKSNPDKSLQELLKDRYNDAITKLKLEEFKVLNKIDRISLKLSSETALKVHEKTTFFRQIILENKQGNTFKRKMLLNFLDEIVPKENEQEVFEKLKDSAIKLPTSSLSENAFVVKYSERGSEEIAKRILRASIATVEHIKPDSKGGGNVIGNFILVCSAANSLRSNMPLEKFIEIFPKIVKRCQIYIEQIIDKIHKNKFLHNETYPFNVRRTLLEESKGKVDLDLSSYKYSEIEAKAIELKNKVLNKKK